MGGMANKHLYIITAPISDKNNLFIWTVLPVRKPLVHVKQLKDAIFAKNDMSVAFNYPLTDAFTKCSSTIVFS